MLAAFAIFIFDSGGLGLDPKDVFMEGTRWQKLARIKGLGCTHFIDDLEELFGEPEYPAGVQGILYDPDSTGPTLPGVKLACSWSQIADYVFRGLN